MVIQRGDECISASDLTFSLVMPFANACYVYRVPCSMNAKKARASDDGRCYCRPGIEKASPFFQACLCCSRLGRFLMLSVRPSVFRTSVPRNSLALAFRSKGRVNVRRHIPLAEAAEATEREAHGIAAYAVAISCDAAAHAFAAPVLGVEERHCCGSCGFDLWMCEIRDAMSSKNGRRCKRRVYRDVCLA